MVVGKMCVSVRGGGAGPNKAIITIPDFMEINKFIFLPNGILPILAMICIKKLTQTIIILKFFLYFKNLRFLND